MLQVGKTTINISAALQMGEAQFKSAFKGKLDADLNEVWKQIEASAPIEAKAKKPKKSFQERLDEELEKKTE
jgi:hypothetical protein